MKVGGALDIHELGNLHDAVIICTGMPAPRLLNIPGESLPGSYTSSQIVGWYNNDPEYLQKNISLRNVKKVAVIGHGNVALDVARLLLKSPESLQNTEISTRALDELRNSSVKEVDIIGRRGPLQVLALTTLKRRSHLQSQSFERCLIYKAFCFKLTRIWSQLSFNNMKHFGAIHVL